MKVLDLCCEGGHRFEGWFASGDAFESQMARGLVSCPVCQAANVRRLPSAPRLNLSGAQAQPPDRSAESAEADALPAPSGSDGEGVDMPTLLRHVVHELQQRTEDVGTRFADEARKIHEGDAPARGIRGQATREEAQSLRDDGIEFMMLPRLPAAH